MRVAARGRIHAVRAGAIAALVTGVALLAGCGSSPSLQATSPSTAASTGSPAASQVASPVPGPSPSLVPSLSPSPSLLPSPSAAPVAVDPGGPAGRPTRVAIPYLRIDLPTVRPPAGSTFPLCNVAEYFARPTFQQPGEGGVTYIYAHARTGMFLAILEASQRNNGKALIGRNVNVWTNGNLRYTYEIVAVRRHQKSLTWVFDLPPDSLVLQTSETPYRDGPKVMVVAAQAGDPVVVRPAEAHPKARPVACR